MKTHSLTSAGKTIVACIFEPETLPEIAVIMNCATGAKQSYFRHFAAYLAQKGILVITYDYSGIGKSSPGNLKGYQTSMSQWATHDLTAVIEYVTQTFSYQRLILVNQSVGGQIAPLSPLVRKEVHAMVNVACSLPYWRLWPFPYNYLFLLNCYLGPLISVPLGYFPGKKLGIMEDLPLRVGLDWGKWVRSPNYLFDHIEGAKEAFATLNFPLLAYSFTDDTTSPPNTVDALNVWYSNCQITHKTFTPEELGVKKIGHFGFFREKCKMLWDDLIEEIS